MKKICLLFIVLFLFTACGNIEEKVIVKAINFSVLDETTKIEFIAYDFSKNEESYTTYTFEDESFNKGFISAINKYNLDLTICDYIFLSNNVINENMLKQVLNILNEFSINIDVNIVVSNDVNENNLKEINDKNIKISPLYSIENDKDYLNALLPVLNKDLYTSSAVLISSDGITSYLSSEELNTALILLSGNKNFNYNFENSNLNALIRNAFSNIYMENNVLYINVFIDIKSRNGAMNNSISNSVFDTKLEYDIQAKVYGLYYDQVVRNGLNLSWVEVQFNQEIEDIIVKVENI